jgi:hypothetical protein
MAGLIINNEKTFFKYNKAQHEVAGKAFDEAGIIDLEPLLISNEKTTYEVRDIVPQKGSEKFTKCVILPKIKLMKDIFQIDQYLLSESDIDLYESIFLKRECPICKSLILIESLTYFYNNAAHIFYCYCKDNCGEDEHVWIISRDHWWSGDSKTEKEHTYQFKTRIFKKDE